MIKVYAIKQYPLPGFILSCCIAAFALMLAACGNTGIPKGVTPVEDFQLKRYLGTWYEIARLDHKFERGLQQVSATYTLLPNGTVQVENKGYSTSRGKWKTATGKAKFVKDKQTGHLKVSFFGPFYGSYIVFELDQQDYQYALVSGPDRSYLWLLARESRIDDELYDSLLTIAESNGFDVAKLIRVEQ